jgi:hypothetical protein
MVNSSMKTVFDPKTAINEILKIIDPVIEKYQKLDQKEFSETLTNVHAIERFKWNLDSLYALINEDTVKHNHAIGLVIRNILTDSYTMAYIMHYNSDGIEESRKLYGMYKDDLDKYGEFFKLMHENDHISKVEYDKFVNIQNSSEYGFKKLNAHIDNNSIKKIDSTSQIVKKLLTNRKQQKHKNINNLYDMLNRSYAAWNKYSKYEHMGYYSFIFSRNRNHPLFQEKLTNDIHEILIASSWVFSSNLAKLTEIKAAKALVDYSIKMIYPDGKPK